MKDVSPYEVQLIKALNDLIEKKNFNTVKQMLKDVEHTFSQYALYCDLLRAAIEREDRNRLSR